MLLACPPALPSTCAESPFEAVRLVNGSSPNQGMVEMLVQGTWMPVRHTLHGLDAAVVCRQLGWVGGLAVSHADGVALPAPTTCARFDCSPSCSPDAAGLHDCGCNGIDPACDQAAYVQCSPSRGECVSAASAACRCRD